MIAITLSEKEAVCKKYPETKFVRTMRQDSKRHHYYMVESGAAFHYLSSMRGTDKTKKQTKGYAKHNSTDGLKHSG